MKTFFRICLVLSILLVLAVAAGYFVISRPAFQKKLIESRLPEGSSIQSIHITTGSIQLTDLKLLLADGSSAKLDSLRSDFSLLAAVFDQTLRLRGLKVDGLVVKLPETSVSAPALEAGRSAGDEASSPTPPVKMVSGPAPGEAPASPTDALYALGEIQWLLDLDSIDLNGALIDASRNRYVFELEFGPIAPGEETTLTAKLKLESREALQGGLKDFNSDLRVVFTQKTSGGFEQLRVESLTEGSDAAGGSLLSISQTLELTVDSFEKSAVVDLSFNADLPKPGVFAPELGALPGLSLQGALQGSAQGQALTLLTADFVAASNDAQVVSVLLKQSLTLGAEQQFSGELMEINLSDLPLAWVNPWLSEGLRLSGQPLSLQIAVSGQDGALELRTLTPLQVGPISLSQDSQALLQEVTLRMNPVIRMLADQSLHYDLGALEVLDRYGPFLSGTVSGAKLEASGDSPLAGLQASARLELGLAELLRQPLLEGKASIMAGQAVVELDIDGAAEYPVQFQSAITGLRARDLPGLREDFRLAAQLKQSAGGGYALAANFAAGPENRPRTSIQLAGQIDPDTHPMPFKMDLISPRIRQSDFDLLIAAAKPKEAAPTPAAMPTTPNRVGNGAGRPSTLPADISTAPPWADLDGQVSIRVEELILTSGQVIKGLNARAIISEPLLAVKDIAAQVEEGSLGGHADVSFDRSLKHAYLVAATLNFKELDPAIFSQKASGTFPVKGRFDGDFKMTGSGATLEGALENSEAELLISGRDGVLTAFELDNRSQLGLLGAGLLGQSLNRPGITALAQAVPYFKDMHFDNFTLKLIRSEDKKVRIPELSFLGENLRISGQGFIAASSLGDVLDQPLDLTLGLGAKGRLIDYLETLGLLQPATAEDGFRAWNKDIEIGGSLADPDTSALKDLLNNAARRALDTPRKSQSVTPPPAEDTQLQPGQEKITEPPAETAPKRSKDEKLRDDIEMGIDLLNSVFG